MSTGKVVVAGAGLSSRRGKAMLNSMLIARCAPEISAVSCVHRITIVELIECRRDENKRVSHDWDNRICRPQSDAVFFTQQDALEAIIA